MAAAAGHYMALTLDKLAKAKGFDPAILARYGVRNGQGGVVIPYHDRQGNEYIKFRIRREPKGGKGEWSWSIGDAPLIPYGLARPIPYTQGFAWIVEGESDCWALWSHDIPALGMPGASTAGQLHGSHLEGLKTVAIVQEPGEAGERFPTRVANRLWDLGFTGKVYAVCLSAKDPRELLAAHPDDFREALGADYKANRRLIEAPKVIPTQTKSQSIGDLLAMPKQHVEWLWDGLLPKGGIGLLTADPKVGKSVFARNLALSVARGRRFLGRRCEGGTVLWVALEERMDHILESFITMGVDGTDPIRIYAQTIPERAIEWLRTEADAFQVSLIVVDTWIGLTRVRDVNDYSAVSAANAPLKALARERGISQLWLHHHNKSGTILGSNALLADVDSAFKITTDAQGERVLSSIQRIGENLEETVLEMDRSNLRINSAGNKYELQVDRAREAVFAALKTCAEPVTREELVKMVEARKQITLAGINELLRDGSVVRTGSGKRGDPIRFSLSTIEITYEDVSQAARPRANIRENASGTTKAKQGPERNHLEPSEPAEPQSEEDADLLMRYAAERFGEA